MHRSALRAMSNDLDSIFSPFLWSWVNFLLAKLSWRKSVLHLLTTKVILYRQVLWWAIFFSTIYNIHIWKDSKLMKRHFRLKSYRRQRPRRAQRRTYYHKAFDTIWYRFSLVSVLNETFLTNTLVTQSQDTYFYFLCVCC